MDKNEYLIQNQNSTKLELKSLSQELNRSDNVKRYTISRDANLVEFSDLNKD
jgi:hypothetical protein